MSPAIHAVLVVVLAVGVDLVFGDPPNRWHPVAWMGRAITYGRARLCRGSPVQLFVAGGALTLGVMALAAVAGGLVMLVAGVLGVAGLALEAAALKSTLALRGLAHAARAVADALAAGDLAAARARLGVHLVSRPTTTLGAGAVASGVIESVAENLTDSFVAPVLFYLVLGLPGALAYRALNTADTMLGYHDGPLEYFGKLAARLDDLANLIAAPLAGLAIVLAAGSRAGGAWKVMVRDQSKPASPNAGWPMAAAAGALGVTLEKLGHYRLGDGRSPEGSDIAAAIDLIRRAAGIVITAAAVVRVMI
jgi:adenosylcobinamide-phosphate synthase